LTEFKPEFCVACKKEAFEVTFQTHELVVVTVIGPRLVPPAAGTFAVSGATVNVHGATGCVTVNVCPPKVIVPVKLLPVLLAGALNDTVPLPVPVVGGVIVRKDAVVAAVQVHDEAEAVNVKLPVPPAAGSVPLVELSVKVQAAAAACVMVTVCAAIVSVPVRLVELVLASML